MMQCKSGIYKIANIETGDFYIGSAVNLNGRFRVHKSTLRNQKHDNQILQRVYNKYGMEKLSFEIVEYIKNINNLISREQHYLDTLNPRYNILKIAGNTLGYKFSQESKNKLSKAQLGNKKHLGHKHSAETKEKLSKLSSRPFKIISPEGETICGVNLKGFCKKNNLSIDCMYRVIKNKNKSHKGYTNAN